MVNSMRFNPKKLGLNLSKLLKFHKTSQFVSVFYFTLNA